MNKIQYRPTEMTAHEAYVELRETRLGGALCCALSGDLAGLANYGFSNAEELKETVLKKANIKIIERDPSSLLEPKHQVDEEGWSVEIDFHAQQSGPLGASTVSAVKVTAYKYGEKICAASKRKSHGGRLNGFDVSYAARKLQRKLKKLGHPTSEDSLEIKGFHSLNRYAT